LFSHPTVPWIIRALSSIFLPLVARSPAKYADVAVWEIVSEEAKNMKRAFWNQYGKEVHVDKRVKTDHRLREQVRENLIQLGGVN
jgi:hypothetical protein